MRTVTMLCYNRPAYFERALAALSKNKELYLFDAIHVFAEPTENKEMQTLLSSLSAREHALCSQIPCSIIIHHNSTKHGTDRNGFLSQAYVFDELKTSVNLHIEDDVIVSPDAAFLALWYEQQPSCKERLCFCLHNHGGVAVSENKHNLSFTGCVHEFNPYGWIATPENWNTWLKREWFTNRWSPDGKVRFGWDWSLNYHCAYTKEAHTLMPEVSRATTIGEFDGVHMSPELWRSEFSYRTIFQG